MGRAFWAPVRHALADSTGNLSNGVAGALAALACILPWLLAFLLLFPLGRKTWRKLRS